MDPDDPRRPLLGSVQRSRASRLANKLCSLESWKKRLPITIWLPKYSFAFLLRDIIAGVTVGLTSIPQGLAYAIVAGLPPQVGLYSSIFPGLVYTLFGSCKDVTVGPTAILAALLAKYVAQSEDFAYLAAFLSGCIILLLGVLQLGFLLDFISKPVISGFTAAAALQIGASQLKSLFRISGSSGQTFISALVNFFKHITTVQLWDTLLGVVTVVALFLLKRVKVSSANTEGGRGMCASTCQYVVRARNAIVVFVGTLLAYILYLRGLQPFALTGKIVGGLPRFGPPPFSTVVNNETVNFVGMLDTFGPQGLVMPLVAILESIAIARAFSGSAGVDATQEMIAIGACNLLSAFAQSMPTTGSFTRTALNHASGVKTSAGAFFKAILVLLAVTLLADAFHFIPRSTLAAIIMVAMVSIIDFSIVNKLWRNSKIELSIYAVTVVTGISAGLEYGILAGAAADALRTLASSARPTVHAQVFKVGNEECASLALEGRLWYASAAYVTHRIRRAAPVSPAFLVLDGRHLQGIDIGVAESLISVIQDLESKQHKFLLWNFPEHSQKLVEELDGSLHSRFVSGPSIDQHVLGLHLDHRNNALP